MPRQQLRCTAMEERPFSLSLCSQALRRKVIISPSKDIDMETTAQSGVRHDGNSLYGRGYRVKCFTSIHGRQHVDIAASRAAVQTGDDPQNQRFVRSLALSPSVPSCPYLIGSLLITNSQSHQPHWDGHSSGLLLEILIPHCHGSMNHRDYPFIASPPSSDPDCTG
jgi:hypothetical protein